MQNVAVYITAPTMREARVISRGLLDKKIIACANIIPGIDSYFWWDKKIDRARECLIIAKTKKNLLKKVIRTVKSNHSYKVPEIIAMPIISGYRPYMDWLNKCLKQDRRRQKGAGE